MEVPVNSKNSARDRGFAGGMPSPLGDSNQEDIKSDVQKTAGQEGASGRVGASGWAGSPERAKQSAQAGSPSQPDKPDVAGLSSQEKASSQSGDPSQVESPGRAGVTAEAGVSSQDEIVIQAELVLALEELAAAQREQAEAQDRFLRLQAEWDNYRKRTANERLDERQRASAQLIERLLPIIDDLERAVEHSTSSSIAAMAEGLAAVLSKLNDVLAYEGLVVIDPAGEPFDLNLHQAVARIEDPKQFDETVSQVYQKGYLMAGRVLRTAMVAVTSGGPVRPEQQAADQSENAEDTDSSSLEADSENDDSSEQNTAEDKSSIPDNKR